MKLYTSTYSKYASGSLEGAWLTLEDYSSKDEFMEACLDLHRDESDPELMFQAHEGIPDSLYSESSVDERLWTLIGLSDEEQCIVNAYIEATGYDLDYALDNALDSFFGTYESGADYAESSAEDLGIEIPNYIVIDWAASWSCNLRHDFHYARYNGELYLFSNG